ncbi:MAG: DUF134 domain-containing protein [Clostridia bacterium]|jgi:predicted DNA-binding protein (UPF0251 family)|nr:DUF134 domain-containing protein [Clostridia bacterium]
MARPARQRRIDAAPAYPQFGPRTDRSLPGRIVMTLDEYETIRLIDLQGLTQAECAVHMDISRTTVQEIYGSAREKLARSLVEGRELCIHGGDCYICSEETGPDGNTVRICRKNQ